MDNRCLSQLIKYEGVIHVDLIPPWEFLKDEMGRDGLARDRMGFLGYS